MLPSLWAKTFALKQPGISCLRGIHHTSAVRSILQANRLAPIATRTSIPLPNPRSTVLSTLLSQRRPFTAGLLNKRPSFDPRFFSSNSSRSSASALSQADLASESEAASAETLPTLTPPSVSYWLVFSATLVFAVIVVGGVTRLTESGLSIVEWQPITGILPPLTKAEWEKEFEKYKETPEFKMINHSIGLSEFKSIFYMEWGHRVLGRFIGLAFVAPLAYFASRKALAPPLTRNLLFLGLLIGFQGALGWYMVKSGLEDSIIETGSVPRVSQYRLAAHLGTAFVLYAGMFGLAMNTLYDWRFAKTGEWGGLKDPMTWKKVVENPIVKRFTRYSKLLAALVFVTALSGAFVAGLDAGLLYNEFPLMGGRLAPPTNELFSPFYAKAADKSDLWWRNILENPTTVQFNHRCLAMASYFSTGALFAWSRSAAVKAALPPLAGKFALAAFGMANVQVALGITTLLYLVPVSLGAAHQAGSVLLLTTVIHLLVALRRPGMAARIWRQAVANGRKF